MRNVILLNLVAALSFLHISCSSSIGLSPAAPSVLSSYNEASRGLSERSVSSAQRTIVKSGSMDVSVSSVKTAGDRLEEIVTKQQGYMTSMSRVQSESHSADYQIRVPAKNLTATMDAISTLGEVNRKRIWVSDETEAVIKFQARLKKLKSRRERYKTMLSSATKLEDKIELEEILSDLEKDIFEMELGLKQVIKHANFSKLSVELERKKIRGPFGLAKDGWGWSWKKLFTIRN